MTLQERIDKLKHDKDDLGKRGFITTCDLLIELIDYLDELQKRRWRDEARVDDMRRLKLDDKAELEELRWKYTCLEVEHARLKEEV